MHVPAPHCFAFKATQHEACMHLCELVHGTDRAKL